ATAPADDWDMNLRIARRGGFALVDQVILNWRRHPGSLSNTSRRWRQGYLAVWKRTLQSTENTPNQDQAAKFVLLGICRSLRREVGQACKRGQVRPAARALTRAVFFYATYYHAVGIRAR